MTNQIEVSLHLSDGSEPSCEGYQRVKAELGARRFEFASTDGVSYEGITRAKIWKDGAEIAAFDVNNSLSAFNPVIPVLSIDAPEFSCSQCSAPALAIGGMIHRSCGCNTGIVASLKATVTGESRVAG